MANSKGQVKAFTKVIWANCDSDTALVNEFSYNVTTKQISAVETDDITNSKGRARVVKSASATDSAASQCSAFQCQCRVSGMIWHWIGTGFMKNRVLKWKSYILFKPNFFWSEN